MGLEIWRIGLKLTVEDSINFFKTEIGGIVKRKKKLTLVLPVQESLMFGF